MGSLNVRIREDLADQFKTMATDRGHSAQSLVNLLVEREIAHRPLFEGQPVSVPLGYTEHAEPLLTSAGSDKKWVVVYRDARDAYVLTVVGVRERQATTVVLNLIGAHEIAVPLDRLVCFEAVTDPRNYHQALYLAMHRYGDFGAVVHTAQLGWFTREY